MIERAFHRFNHAPAEPAAELVSVEETRAKRDIVSMQYLGLLAAEQLREQGIKISGWQPQSKRDRVWLDHQLFKTSESSEEQAPPAAA